MRDRIEIFHDQKIKNFIEKREFQYAVLLRKSDANYISRKPANMEQGRPLFHTMVECPLPCSIVYGLRYGSPYLPIINKLLHHLFQGGILQHWAESEEYTLYQKRGMVLFSADNKERKALTMGNLREVFFVLFFGYTISGIIFIAEMLSHKFTQRLNHKSFTWAITPP